MKSLTIRRWSVDEWMSSEVEWSQLLAQSGADKLFLSWEWLTLWWRSFGVPRNYQPYILGFYRGDRLVGVAPLYRVRIFRRGIVPARSVQFIGLSWRDPTPLISEYLDVIALREEAEAVRCACMQQLLDEGGWTELVVGYTEAGEAWKAGLAKWAHRSRYYVREMDHAVSYQAHLEGGFQAYLRKLGQSSRRSVWNLRRRLEAHGAVRLERVAATEISEAFEELNILHTLRWRRPAFGGSRLRFHQTLAQKLAAKGEFALTRLRVGNRVVSVLYDIQKDSHQYNLKMGFDPAFELHASVGLLHLGYAMEAAAHNNVRVYDFLAGPGRTTDFKRHLSQGSRELRSVQMLRGYVLPKLYRWHDLKNSMMAYGK